MTAVAKRSLSTSNQAAKVANKLHFLDKITRNSFPTEPIQERTSWLMIMPFAQQM